MVNDSGRKFYFPFIDKRLSYNCHSCGYSCCRGQSATVSESEFNNLVLHYPSAKIFLSRQSNDFQSTDRLLHGTSKGCNFLGNNGLCRVEVELGRSAKPFVCRAFPLLSLHEIGNTTVLSFKTHETVNCPIEVTPESDQNICQESLLKDLVFSSVNSFEEHIVKHPNFTEEAELLLQTERQSLNALNGSRFLSILQVFSIGFQQNSAEIERLLEEIIAKLGLDKNLLSKFQETNHQAAVNWATALPILRINYLCQRDRLGYAVAKQSMLGFFLYLAVFHSEQISLRGITETTIDSILASYAKYFEIIVLLNLLEKTPTFTLPHHLSLNSEKANTLLYLLQTGKKMSLWELLEHVFSQKFSSVTELLPMLGSILPLASSLYHKQSD